MNKYYLRNSAGVYEASHDQLRSIFLQSAAAGSHFSEIRRRRNAKIRTGETPVEIYSGVGQIVVHIMPTSALASSQGFDLAVLEGRSSNFKTIGGQAGNTSFNADGFIAARGGVSCYGYTQIFRDGTIEATRADIIRAVGNTPIILAMGVEKDILVSIPEYVEGLRQLGCDPPLYVGISLLGTQGVRIACGDIRYLEEDDLPPALRRPVLDLPTCVLPDFGDKASRIAGLRPALDALWNAAGLPRWSND